MVFSHNWEMAIWLKPQDEDEILTTENSSMGFLPLCCGGWPKWMKVNVSKVFWLLTTVELWLQGWKQEVSWTSWKFVKIIMISPLGNSQSLSKSTILLLWSIPDICSPGN